MKICIDAGHNDSGFNTGATGNGIREQDITFAIANRLNILFAKTNIKTILTRPTKSTNLGTSNATSLSERVRIANEFSADLFISIHCNAGGGTGTETLVYSDKSASYPLAQYIQNEIVSKIGTKNRGVKLRSDLAVLKNTNMPSVLVETAFIDNTNDANLLKNNTDDFAQAIFNAICEHYKIGVKNMSKFNDIDGHYAKNHIEKLADYGIVNGDGKGNFNPDNPITRADVAVIVANALTVLGK